MYNKPILLCNSSVKDSANYLVADVEPAGLRASGDSCPPPQCTVNFLQSEIIFLPPATVNKRYNGQQCRSKIGHDPHKS